jgi:hypothetical protein
MGICIALKLMNNKPLKLAAETSADALKVALLDRSVDPTLDLMGLIWSSCVLTWNNKICNRTSVKRDIDQAKAMTALSFRRWGSRQEQTSVDLLACEMRTNILVRDDRVKIERLKLSALRAFCWALEATITDRVDGYILASEMIGNNEKMGRVMEGNDLYSLLLSFIILKRPTNKELMRWMIDRQDEQLSAAASNVLDNRDDTSPFRPLLLCLVYPTMSIETLMREYNVRDGLQLVGAHIGAKMMKINKRLR